MAIAISGWLQGSDEALDNLSNALSLYDVRLLVEKYLREPLAAERESLLQELRSQEGSTVPQIARLLRFIKPPLASEPADAKAPGYYRLEIPGPEGEDVAYFVQLPPQYDPHRRYPAVVTLNGGGSTPEQQIDWWAGDRTTSGQRIGQASRHGYIIISVAWQKPHQAVYEYSAREHHAVLGSLRDAMRRFSIDSNRVFLSGHSIGGNAAWDIGLAHPDLWAGVIPVVAVADRYCAFYWENARYVPMYIIAGELDGDKMVRNGRDLDRYLRRGYDTTVVEFLGRGHENFYDEIQRIFDWMNRKQRDFFPKEFTCVSLRSWDNYFWWVEMGEMPARSLVDPANWPPPRGTRAATLSAKVAGGSIHVKSASDQVTIWLAPELIDFDKRTTITVNGQRAGRDPFVRPDLAVLLEDVRTRGDRLLPFWGRVDVPDGRQASRSDLR
jgi:acetyl esterase/lipase